MKKGKKNRHFDLHNSKYHLIFALANAKIAQLVEHNLAKVRVAGSSPVFRSENLLEGCWFFKIVMRK